MANIVSGGTGPVIALSDVLSTLAGGGIALGNSQTTYTSGTVNLSVVAGNLTIRSTTGQALQFSMSQTVQAETQTFVGGIAMNAATTYTSGTVVLSAGANITLGSNAQTITISGVASQTVQTQNLVAISASNALFSSGTVVMSGFGAATVNTAAGTIRISVPTQTSQTFVGGIAVDALTTYTSGTVVFSRSNGITFGTNAQTITASVAAGATATGNLGAVAINALTTYTSGTVVLSDSNGVTFGTNAQTVTASVNQSISMFAVSNTTQSSSGTAHKSALSFAGAGVASVGVTGGSVVISVPSGGGAGDGGVFAGVSTGGNTAGSTGTVSTGNLVLVGSQGITLSQSTGAAGSAATVTILGPGPVSYWDPMDERVGVMGQQGQSTLHMRPVTAPNVAFDRIIFPINFVGIAGTSTGAATISVNIGFYTNNASTLSLMSSTSTTTAVTHGTASSSAQNGWRLVSIASTGTLTAGHYWVGILSRTASAVFNATISQLLGSQINTNFSGLFGVASNASNQVSLGLGIYSAQTTNVINAIPLTDIRGTGSLALRAPRWYLTSGTG